MKVILKVCLEVAPVTVVLSKTLYFQSPRLYEFRFYPSFNIVGPPPFLLVLARSGPKDMLAVKDERI